MKQNALFQEYVDSVGSRLEASRRLCVNPSMISHILNGRRGVSPEVALRIERDSGGRFRKERFIWPDEPAA